MNYHGKGTLQPINLRNYFLNSCQRPLLDWIGNLPTRCSYMPQSEAVVQLQIQVPQISYPLLKGITDLLHLALQLYNSFASRHEAATGGLIPYQSSKCLSGYFAIIFTTIVQIKYMNRIPKK